MKIIEKGRADTQLVSKDERGKTAFPFPVPTYRFDQKKEVFKRSRWDEEILPSGKRYYEEIEFQQKVGFQKLDYVFSNAAWNVERNFGFGNRRSNSGLYSWDEIPAKTRTLAETEGAVKKSPEEMSRITKKVAKFLGADLVGICRVHPNWVYSHEFNAFTKEHYPIEIPEGCHNAIVMAIAMDYDAIRYAPSGIASAATGLGYSQMAFVTNLLATFIRGLGYRAIPAGNDTAISIPLAMAAGLGEYSRMGLLITEKFGPRVRICKVFTDLPLHLDSYRPFGVVEFCKTCKRCAVDCPPQAISHGDMTQEGPTVSNHHGALKWYINGEKCFGFWAKNRMNCTICMRICPFNKPSGVIHDAVRGMIKKTTLFNRSFVWLDVLLGYNRPYPAKRFWNGYQ